MHFCTFVYTQVIGPFLRSASFPRGVPGLGDYCDSDGTKDGNGLTSTNPITWLNDMYVM